MVLFEGFLLRGRHVYQMNYYCLDAKYSRFIATKSPESNDLRYQFLQKYWNTLPQKGNINIYFRSWYSHFLDYKK